MKTKEEILQEAIDLIQGKPEPARIYNFDYSIKQKDTTNSWIGGYIRASSEHDAIMQLIEQYARDPKLDIKCIRVKYQGFWADFERDLERRWQGD
jgi:hypothetical protein